MEAVRLFSAGFEPSEIFHALPSHFAVRTHVFDDPVFSDAVSFLGELAGPLRRDGGLLPAERHSERSGGPGCR